MSNALTELFRPLSEIAEINPPLPRYVNDDEPVTFLGMAEVLEGGGIQSPMVFNYVEVKSGFTRFAEHDTLFAKITPCMENGKGAYATNLVNGIGCGSTEFHVLRAKENGDPNFIYHVTMSQEFRRKAEMNMTGSAGQRRVPSDFFREYGVYIPGTKSQKKIAKILTTIDQLIEKTQALIDKHTAIKQGMMADLFSRGIDLTTGKLRPPVEQAHHLYKETELGWVPKEWSVLCLKKVVEKIADRDHFTPNYTEYGVPIISPKDFNHLEKIEFAKCKYISLEEHQKNRKKTDLKVNDIVFTRIGAGLGKACLVTEDMPEFSILHSAAMIRPDLDSITPAFLLYHLKHYFLQRQISVEVQSIGVPDLGLDKINGFKVVVPSLKEQNEITKKIQKCDYEIEMLFNQLYKIRHKKNGLMQDLLTGKVTVNPA